MDRKSKFKIYQVDAYRKLKSSQKKYNLIVSEPSSLWVSGVELLFSLEFLYEVKSHLKEKGIYTQWFPLFDMDTETFRMILANFNTVFPHVTLWFTSPYTVNIVATKERIEIDENKLKQRFEEQKKVYNKYNIKQYQTILGYQALPEGTAKGLVYDVEKLHSIEWPRLEFLSNKNRYISSVVNLNEFLKLKILKPLPVSNTEFKYLYEDLKNNLEEEFYLHNITRLQQFGRPTDFLHKKMLYNYVNKFKSPQLKLNENILNVLNYYMTGEGSVSLNIESKYKEALKIIDIFKKAMIMHLPVKVENLLELIPVECKEINNCYKIKKYVTHQIFDQKKPSATKITKKDWAKIEEEFKQLKAQ